MTSGGHWLCIHLDASGRPCNRRTMKPLTCCVLHREQPERKGGKQYPEAKKRWRMSRRNAGLAPGMEAA